MSTAPRCTACKTRACRNGKDCFHTAAEHRRLYDVEGIARLHRAASAIEARHYAKQPRIREIMLFANELGFHKLGLAFCIGLAAEAETVAAILEREFDVVSICCKHCGIEKASMGLERINPDNPHEVMCNPAGQATALNENNTDLNILCGLCVGHDAIFSMVSRAPVITLIAKDRVLAHNPAGALYSRYTRRTLLPETE